MTKATKTVFVCQECGSQSAKWSGQCKDCGAWNSFVEERPAEVSGASAGHRYAAAGGGASTARLYSEIEIEQHSRISTGIGEFDRVLGGGIVPGSLVLLGGEPGIGKSTLLLQAAANLARAVGPVLYSSGEESEHQVKSRGERLAVGHAPLYLLAETCLERILEEIARIKPALVIVDSIQTVFSLKFQSAPGSIGQVREAATQLLFAAKTLNVPTFVVGHVTKEGNLAGPKALEHIVDTVLYFEGERHHSHRVVRAVKNRFGAISELGVFEMTGEGLRAVANPSALFLAERPVNTPGSAVHCSVEGSRPLLVEVQALVSESDLEIPRRVVSGIDRNRLALVLAVLARHGGVGVGTSDVFVNVVGGVRIDEPGADLAVALAVASAARGIALTSALDGAVRTGDAGEGDAPPLACFGELGLTGELRTVAHAERRIAEARKFGLTTIVTPEAGTLRAVLRPLRGRGRASGSRPAAAA
jgi:DNA repair protein RadA/Sms